jgi:streptogramin lyase
MQRFSPKFALRPAAFSACAAAIVCLSGCAGISGTAVPNSLTTSIPKGSLHGGQQPIQYARVYVYAANATGGYGSASTSLITNQPGTAQDTAGHYYVTTDSSGSFSYAGTVTCPTATTQIYLLALGGNTTGHSGVGNNNTALALSAALGNCSTINSTTFTSMNEVTTAAMTFALNAFMIDGGHIGSPASNSAGLVNAFATVPNLVDNTTGTALAVTPSTTGAAPQKTLNTLGNIIAPCANSGSSSSAACSSLFSHSSTSAGTPTDTIGALLNIAAFPAAQAANLYGDALATAPFQPALTTQPNDFSLGITFSPSVSVIQPGVVVIDASGNLWMANCQSCVTATATDTLVKYGPSGTFLASYSNTGLHNTKGLAIDSTGTYIYSINQAVAGSTHTSDQLTKMLISTGALQSGFPITFASGTYGTNAFQGIALDNSGEIWATATTAGAIVETDPNGNLINGSPFFVGGTAGVGTDNVGNIWFAGVGGNNILQFDTNGDFLNNFTPSGLSQPLGIAINGSNEIWTVDNGTNSLSKIEFFNGANGSGSPYSNLGLYQAAITAIDGANQVLIPNCRAGCPGSGSTAPDGVVRINQSGVANDGGINTTATLQVPGLNGTGGAAIDASGNVWLSNSVTGTVTQGIGLASPTIQPIALGSSTAKLGQLP